MLRDSGVVELDVGGLMHIETLGDTKCHHLTRVIATAPTTVVRFAGLTVEYCDSP